MSAASAITAPLVIVVSQTTIVAKGGARCAGTLMLKKSVEGEEFVRDGNGGIACGGDRLEQLKGAAKFLVEHGAG
jgi:hypothetical protein